MFVTSAYAQAAGPVAGGGGDLLLTFAPFVLIFVIMYVLIIRPQQQRVKDHQNMIKALRRGDNVVTSGGLVGKVTKAVEGESEIEVEIASDVRVKVVRSMISEVRTKGEPVKEKA